MTLYCLSSYWSYFLCMKCLRWISETGKWQWHFWGVLQHPSKSCRGTPRSNTLGKAGRLWWHKRSLELNAKSIKCSSVFVVSLGQNSYAPHWISGLGEKKQQPTPTILRFELLISFFSPPLNDYLKTLSKNFIFQIPCQKWLWKHKTSQKAKTFFCLFAQESRLARIYH